MTQVFRIVFSKSIKEPLYEFSKIHKGDKIQEFKEAWSEWCDEHNDELKEEYDYQLGRGVNSNNVSFDTMLQKLFVSARYYYRKCPSVKETRQSDNTRSDRLKESSSSDDSLNNEKALQKRRLRKPYIKIDKTLLEFMDDHIEYEFMYTSPKPSQSYYQFYDEYQYNIATEIVRLRTLGITKNQALNKIKKTYKNRFYRFSS